MTIAIIGAGNVGGALATSSVRALRETTLELARSIGFRPKPS
jgi:predicted dinucleotide-binding enzyme